MIDTRSGFAETARGRIYFEVSGPERAPPLMFLAMSTSKGGMAEIGRAYQQSLSPDFLFLTCDYPAGTGGSERKDDPPPMTPDQVAADYIAIADAAGFDRFACAGYSVGGNMSIQLAVRYPERLTALIVGGWPAVDGDFKSTFDVCRQMRVDLDADTPLSRYHADHPELRASAAGVAADFITYYEALQDWDDRQAARTLRMPRLNFADAEDMGYPANNAAIEIGPALVRNEAELREMGWETHVIRTRTGPDGAHLAAVQADVVVPIVREFLARVL